MVQNACYQHTTGEKSCQEKEPKGVCSRLTGKPERMVQHMGFGFGIMSIIVPVMFLVVFGMIISTLVRDFRRRRKDDASPRLTVSATVVTKRTQVGTHHHNHNNMGSTTYRTRYFATFQVDSGDRMELQVEDYDFGMLVEGDRGQLTFQGSRFLSFHRI